MTDPPPIPADPPLVNRVAEEPPPLVVRPKPRPGLIEAGLLTVAYAVVIFGTILVLVVAVVFGLALSGNKAALEPAADGGPAGAVGTLPPAVAAATAYAVVLAYGVALVFTLGVFRLVVGRGWAREVGLDRLPPRYLVLALIAFPAFSVGSDLLAQLVAAVVGTDPAQEEAARSLGDLFRGFHWSFAVFAIGVCPGVAEELWCRGFLGRGLVGRYGRWLGVLYTSLFFGLLHVYPPVYVFLTAVMGAALHFTYLTSRSLWVPILIHLLNNGLAALGAVGVLPDSMGRAFQDNLAAVSVLTIGALGTAGTAMLAAREPGTRGRVAVWAVPAAGCSAGLVWLSLA